MEKITTSYSLWYVPLCLLAGMIYAVLLYYRESKNEFSSTLRWGLAVLRAIVVAGIAFLLLNPLIRSVKKHSEKPVVLMLQDNSESIALGKDSSYYREAYPIELERFMDEVRSEYDVQPFLFGRGLLEGAFSMDYSAQETNVGMALDDIYDRFSHKNIGAMVVLSDGINNRGMNPLYTDHNFNFPIYTVALGDTSHQLDLVLSRVNFNRIAYLGNMFPVEINVTGRKAKGRSAEITIERNNEVLFKESVTFNSENEFKTLLTSLEAKQTGLQKYTVKVSGIDGEVSLDNNVSDIYVDVLEDKQKILLLSDAPHPDVSAIKQAVGENINYAMDEFLISDFTGTVKGYNLVVLHGLPSARNNATAILSQIAEENIPALFILTRKTFLPLFNEQKTGIVVGMENLLYNEALPAISHEFTLFGISDRAKEAMGYFPPLISPYGNIELLPSASPFLFQQIGTVATRQPLWIFNQTIDRKTSVILGPGLWKWRIKTFAVKGNHDAFNDILNKAVQYLALRVDKSLFRVYGRNSFAENEGIEFEAELYNEVYELVNDEDVSITLTGSDGTSYPYTFTKTSKAYYLNVGNLPAGSYSYSASVESGGKRHTENGEFTVLVSRLEKLNVEADHNLMLNLARKYGGEMVLPNELGKLAELISGREDIKTITYSQKRFSELLNIPYLLGLILLLLSAEWFTRKRAGGY